MLECFVGVDQSLLEPGISLVGINGEILVASSHKIKAYIRGAQRLNQIHTFLITTFTTHHAKILFAALEGPSLGSVHREFDLGEISGVIRQTLYTLMSVEPLVVAPTQLKQFATGRGNADKTEVLNAVNTQWNLALTNDNAADAVVLAQIARAAYQKTRCNTRVQTEVIAALNSPTPRQRRLRRKPTQNI